MLAGPKAGPHPSLQAHHVDLKGGPVAALARAEAHLDTLNAGYHRRRFPKA